jgi:hypothetical protein
LGQEVVDKIQADVGVGKGEAMTGAVDDVQVLGTQSSGQFCGPLGRDDAVVTTMEQEGGGQGGKACAIEAVLIEQQQILGQAPWVKVKFSRGPDGVVAVAIEVPDQAKGVDCYPREHLLQMPPRETASGRACAMKMGKAADDNQEACLRHQAWGEEVETE